ncbi:hypothetical protein MMC06_004663 [Schaereria dolodes]|nr:hypothetical protein [Schaereria dolodes]
MGFKTFGNKLVLINISGDCHLAWPQACARLSSLKVSSNMLQSTNGSKVTEKWLLEYGKYLDIMAVSCDSFNEATNKLIGRGTGKGAHLPKVKQLSRSCKAHGIKFKINTVVNRFNFEENMNSPIQEIGPFRWKCFQVLVVEGENDSDETLRDARKFKITNEEFDRFCKVHEQNDCFVKEGNDVMNSSYLLLDEYMCFLNKNVGEPTKSILEIGVAAALEDVYWDEEGFKGRGGIYDWTRSSTGKDHSAEQWDW